MQELQGLSKEEHRHGAEGRRLNRKFPVNLQNMMNGVTFQICFCSLYTLPLTTTTTSVILDSTSET